MHPGRVWIAPDVGTRALKNLAVDTDPRVPRGVWRLAEDIGAVVDTVEVDRLAVVADPVVRRRGQTDHRGECCPTVDMRHHLVILRACGDVVGPPHDAWNAPAAFKWRAFLAAERRRAGVGIGIQPGAV